MRCELPILLRCCFCFPLRYGLLFWAYIKQILSSLYLALIIFKFYEDYRRMPVVGYVVMSAIIILTIVDIVFHVFFIVSAHTKNHRIMRIFYRYSIGLLIVNMIIIGLYIGSWLVYIFHYSPYMAMFLWSIILPAMGMVLVLICSQGYLIILVRSEFMKLKNNSQFEFVNNAIENKCAANNDFLKGTQDNEP